MGFKKHIHTYAQEFVPDDGGKRYLSNYLDEIFRAAEISI
jgi:hypothetical protein